jgi:hypothetical protein
VLIDNANRLIRQIKASLEPSLNNELCQVVWSQFLVTLTALMQAQSTLEASQIRESSPGEISALILPDFQQ